ncbi:MAG: hypothetical protein ACI8ZB_002218 [Desulforhopalus sp.]|jgi:hypothetical protein
MMLNINKYDGEEAREWEECRSFEDKKKTPPNHCFGLEAR